MKVELLDIFGSDDTIVDVARVSYNKTSAHYTPEQNIKLIKYLADHNHWSPFSHPQLRFRIEMPIYVERQLMKTEAGRVFNSISGRYVDFSDTYTRIDKWRYQSKDSKQGSEGDLPEDQQELASMVESVVISECQKAYRTLENMGIAKEQIRSVLPMSLNTTQIWTGSFYTLVRLCWQRLKPDAQKETGDVAREMLRQVKASGNFNESLKAFNLWD